jgi:hypothetical protein
MDVPQRQKNWQLDPGRFAMIRLSKSVLAVGGVILAGGLIAVMTPRTVHALAAALVQVTNTASNPVVTQNVEQITQVQVFCGVGPCKNSSGEVYVIPSGLNLVVTAIDLTGCASFQTTAVLQQVSPPPFSIPGFPRIPINLPATTNTTHLIYPSGIQFSGTTTLSFTASQACDTAGATVYGYLSPT